MTKLRPHSDEWYDRLSQLQRGYFYPWQSTIAEGGGEDAYLSLVRDHLARDKDVLDMGCGHGELALQFADDCRTIVGHDRVAPYIRMANKIARDRRIKNASFTCADTRDAAATTVGVLAEHEAFDLVISRRGPLSWIPYARQIARTGAVLIQLNPALDTQPHWNRELPESLRYEESGRFGADGCMKEAVEARLSGAGLKFHSCWHFDVPETFHDPKNLYLMLSWGRSRAETPSYQQVRRPLEQIFRRHASEEGLALPHRRFLWKAVID
ncbi:MAG: hypothetical protein CMJ49_00380 [Planctomycetaceae bacterium]|nr:hypothetical protein [Planctomycetaceae bacterium]